MGTQRVSEDDPGRFFGISTEILCILGFNGLIRRVNRCIGSNVPALFFRPLLYHSRWTPGGVSENIT